MTRPRFGDRQDALTGDDITASRAHHRREHDKYGEASGLCAKSPKIIRRLLHALLCLKEDADRQWIKANAAVCRGAFCRNGYLTYKLMQ
ncbi:unnamed protein product [Caenorhabditis auriculariae]|uniref:Uncharacterized protein n=1 Tax=Caenorhabditis auriculariae TaxID=2777116 RepID=A0A8S1HHS7_9PELO|nr:unnamed protein product [Caenorhabditis auriculariae]